MDLPVHHTVKNEVEVLCSRVKLPVEHFHEGLDTFFSLAYEFPGFDCIGCERLLKKNVFA